MHPAKEGPVVAKDAVASISPPDKAVMEDVASALGPFFPCSHFADPKREGLLLTRLGKARDS